MDDHNKLLAGAAQLARLGFEVEAARREVRLLVEAKTPYESEEMLAAVGHFQQLKDEWDILEQRHLALRRRLEQRGVGISWSSCRTG